MLYVAVYKIPNLRCEGISVNSGKMGPVAFPNYLSSVFYNLYQLEESKMFFVESILKSRNELQTISTLG